MKLCFGIFGKILNLCRKNSITQAPFTTYIVACINPESSIINANFLENIQKFIDEPEMTIESMDYDDQAISKLLNCARDLPHTDKEKSAQTPKEDTLRRFDAKILPYIDEDKKADAMLAMLDIIRNDHSLDTDKKETFKMYLGIEKDGLFQKSQLPFTEFMVGILQYTICGNVDNTAGKTYVSAITDEYMADIVKPYQNEYQWDASSQTLIFPCLEMFQIFQGAIIDYKIKDFIETVDPTNRMSYEYVDSCDSFIKFLKNNILIPFDSKYSCSPTVQNIAKFANTLDKYIVYVGHNMCPIEDRPNTMIPIYGEDSPNAIVFEKKTKNYREQLIAIYGEIYKYISTFTNPLPDEPD